MKIDYPRKSLQIYACYLPKLMKYLHEDWEFLLNKTHANSVTELKAGISSQEFAGSLTRWA